jgi:KDO2-lipid IV(A) lauroyltransferase
MHQNYRRVFPDAPPARVRRLARASLVNYCRYLADFARFPSRDREWFRSACVGETVFAGLHEANAGGRGVVVALMHMGCWDTGAGATVARGFDGHVIAERFTHPRLNALVLGARERLGLHVIPMETAGPSLVRVLRRGGVLGVLVDRPTPGSGVEVTFFGARTEVPAGPAWLALRTGSALVAAAFVRRDPWRHGVEAVADFTIDTTPGGDMDADVRRVTQAIMAAHETFILRYPEQWYMFRDMWGGNRRDDASDG